MAAQTHLISNPLTQLAFSLHENKGVYAALLGSGLSRSAEIPTGWEITLDLIRRIALAQGISEEPDWAAWYRETTGNEPNYSTLLAELASSPDERRSILQSYIEANAEDREAGRKIPTAAHHAIAELVRMEYIRVIITTNFDRLMESALRERGIEPTVVASVDALFGAEPITHSACYLLKLHGDYKDARILNTEAELSGYPPQYDALLDRIFDEHGLIVAGWSGNWDNALRAAFLRAPNRRYSMFWFSRGAAGEAAQELIARRSARVIAAVDADSAFSQLLQSVETLEQNQQQNPLSIELVVASTKRLLAKPEFRIQLDELFKRETDRVQELLDGEEFGTQASLTQSTFRLRVANFEAVSEALASMAGVLGRWGDDVEIPLVIDMIRSLYARAEKVVAGDVISLSLRAYPAVLVFTAFGLGAVRAERWSAFHRLLDTVIDRKSKEMNRVVDLLFLSSWKGAESNETWRLLDGLAKRKTALSDHLLQVFTEWSKRFVGLDPDFELSFERFEMLCSLCHLEQRSKENIVAELSGEPQNQKWAWMPVGRSGWHNTNAQQIIGELEIDPMRTALLQAGFAKGDKEVVDLFVKNFGRIAGRMKF